MSFKSCSQCKIEKPEEDFYRDKQQKSGRYPSCKKCNYSYKKKYSQSHKEYYNQKQKEFYITPKGQYNSYKQAAKHRNHEFKLTLEEFMEFWQKPCFYCNDEIETIGLDRLNNTIGYIKYNLISCCTICNRMKYIHSAEEFLKKCKQIVENFNTKVEL